MKIVILVDYSNSQFNLDFEMSNNLIDFGHSVFLVSNSAQLDFWENKYDCVILGYSFESAWKYSTIKPVYRAENEEDMKIIRNADLFD